MSDHPNPLWLRWLGHTLHGEMLSTPLPGRSGPERFDAPAPLPSPEEIAAAVRESGLPYGFPFSWM